MGLNERALKVAQELCPDSFVQIEQSPATVYDLGTSSSGIQAGIQLARICTSDLATIQVNASDKLTGLEVSIQSDQPLKACMASQYAGWPINAEKYFAMGSGPMRAVRGKEDVLVTYQLGEESDQVVGVLETGKLPTAQAIEAIATQCNVSPDKITLVCAPTSSIAGTVQIVARSLETAIHKLDELKFDLHKIVSGFGAAPLPPIAKDDLAAIGWTNDAILYGGRVSIWVNCEDDEIEAIGDQVPSNSSKDHGRSFKEIFAAYDHDFYKIDPMLFSPAEITFFNLKSGGTFRFGQLDHKILKQSFGLKN